MSFQEMSLGFRFCISRKGSSVVVSQASPILYSWCSCDQILKMVAWGDYNILWNRTDCSVEHKQTLPLFVKLFLAGMIFHKKVIEGLSG